MPIYKYKQTKEHSAKIGLAHFKDLTNKKFGKLLVIERLEERGNRNQIKWECLCDCGKKHKVTGESLRDGKSTSCGCKRLSPYNKNSDREDAVWKQLYRSTIEKRSKKKGYKSNISYQDFKLLSSQKCFYCGILESSFATDRFGTKGTKTSDTIIYYNGLDRIDSRSGYMKNNVVPCCKHCNTAKNTMTQKEFYQFIKRVYEYNF
jgi:hypothetical protein